MNPIKAAFWLLGFAAAYQVANVFVFGRPIDAEKALTEWVAKAKSELPKDISATATLIDVDFSYHKPYGFASFYEPVLKKWDESYELALESPESFQLEKEKLVAYICRSELHQKLIDMEVEINVAMRPKKNLRPPDFSVGQIFAKTPSWDRHFEKRMTVGKANCI